MGLQCVLGSSLWRAAPSRRGCPNSLLCLHAEWRPRRMTRSEERPQPEETEVSSIPLGSDQSVAGRATLPKKLSAELARTNPIVCARSFPSRDITPHLIRLAPGRLTGLSPIAQQRRANREHCADPEPSLAGHPATLKRELPPQPFPPKLGLVHRLTAKASRHRRRDDRRQEQRQDDGVVA